MPYTAPDPGKIYQSSIDPSIMVRVDAVQFHSLRIEEHGVSEAQFVVTAAGVECTSEEWARLGFFPMPVDL